MYLNWYYNNCQKNIVLVSRGTKEDDWAKRCLYLDEKYSPKVKYNHRSILDCEIVIEYDIDNQQLNERLARLVCERLRSDNIKYAMWSSGNKSAHVHFLIKLGKPKNLSLLKTTVMKYYGEFFYDKDSNKIYKHKNDVPQGVEPQRILPDLRLAGTHLIRAEFGVNEKTQKEKSKIISSDNYPCLSVLPNNVWELYENAQKFSVAIRIGQQTKDLFKTDVVKMLTDSVQFKDNMDDGRERVMFALIHVLKGQYKNQDDLADFLYEWYTYSSNQAPQMSYQDVLNKVKYHWSRDYRITESYLKRLIEEVSGKTWEEIKGKGQQKLN